MMTRLFVLPALIAALCAGEALAQSRPDVTQACTALKASRTGDEVRARQALHDRSADLDAARRAFDRRELDRRALALMTAETDYKKIRDRYQELALASEADLRQEYEDARNKVRNIESKQGELTTAQTDLNNIPMSIGAGPERRRLETEIARLTGEIAQTDKTGAESGEKKAKRNYDDKLGIKAIAQNTLAARDAAAKAERLHSEETVRVKAHIDIVNALQAYQHRLQQCAAEAQQAIQQAAATPATPKPPVAGGKIGPILPLPSTTPLPAADALCGEIKAAATLADVDSLYRTHHGTVTQELQRLRGLLAELETRRKATDDAAAANPNQKVTLSNNQTFTMPEVAGQIGYQRRQFERQVTRWQDLDTALQTCATERKAALSGPTFDELLAALEANLSEVEAMAPLVPGHCSATANGAIQATAAADRYGAEADALAAQASALRGGSASAPVQKANADAAAAAAAVAQSRTRAQQAMQTACAASRLALRDPKDPGLKTQIAEAQRHGKLAENEVTVSANALQQIRSAYSAAQAAASVAPGASPVALGNKLDELRAHMAGLASVPAGLQGQLNNLVGFFTRVNQIDSALARVTGAAADSDLGRYAAKHTGRIGRISARQAALRAVLYCVPALQREIANLQAHYNAANAKLQQAAVPVAAARAASGAGAILQAIETLYNNSRSLADGTAADAAAALRCAADAGKVTPPGPGIKCTYKYPGGQNVVVEIFDRTTCPEVYQGYPAVQSATDPKQEMMKDFEGTYVAHNGSVFVLSGSVNNPSITAKWVGGPGHMSQWSGTCARNDKTNINVLNCTSQGTYEDSDKRVTTNFAFKLTTHGDSIDIYGKYTSAPMVMKHAGMKPYGRYTRLDEPDSISARKKR